MAYDYIYYDLYNTHVRDLIEQINCHTV